MKYRIKRFSKYINFGERGFSDTLEDIKERIVSHIPSKEIIIEEASKRVLEKLDNDKKFKKESREDIKYEDRPIRRNNIVIRKPEIRYRKEDIHETPEMIHKSIMEFPDEE